GTTELQAPPENSYLVYKYSSKSFSKAKLDCTVVFLLQKGLTELDFSSSGKNL
uniref:Uncharacterized protein n=1 Tax=Oryza brachyantha TaxID=4533 RepID=J3N2Y5_ORYBR